MSSAASQSHAATTGTNRDTISGGAVNPYLAAVALLVIGFVVYKFLTRKK